MTSRALLEMVRAQKRGEPRGIWSVCSAHPAVLEASMEQGLADGQAILVESTSNQVNPEGGYTGQTPADFARALAATAQRLGFPADRLILGGDHLGPFPWQREPASSALAKSRRLVRECVLAGYDKIHLDASMACADDPGGAGGPLDEHTVAERTADLLEVAETAADERGARERPVYVVGTEVPTPGGEQQDQAELAATRPEAALRFLDLARAAIVARGFERAWERVIALVVQPGVEFGDHTIHEYDRARARALKEAIGGVPGVVFEAHSTDYQTPEALRALVEDHFAVLKVGPALTFAYREAIFALAHVEEEWGSGTAAPSGIRAALERTLLARPGYWEKYYHGDEAARRFARAFSFSDRVRYYWPVPDVQEALGRLFASLARRPLPLTLLSQYLPWALAAVRAGAVPNEPGALVRFRIREVTEVYSRACGGPKGS